MRLHWSPYKNISAPVIATLQDPDTIILTSKDNNWNRQTLYRSLTRINLSKYLSSGGDIDNYEFRRANANQSSSGTTSYSDSTGDGISKKDAESLLAKHGVNLDEINKSYRIASGWLFYTDRFEYEVWDDGTTNLDYPNTSHSTNDTYTSSND